VKLIYNLADSLPELVVVQPLYAVVLSVWWIPAQSDSGHRVTGGRYFIVALWLQSVLERPRLYER